MQNAFHLPPVICCRSEKRQLKTEGEVGRSTGWARRKTLPEVLTHTRQKLDPSQNLGG